MNIKDMLLPFVLALATWWGIQYFFSKKAPVDQYKFTAPQSALECKPLNKDIDFASIKRTVSPTVSTIKTSWGDLEFSTEGASLSRLEFKRALNGTKRLIGTIFPQPQSARDDSAFIVALNGKTPWYYKLVDRKEDENSISLSYQASTDQGSITKTFIIFKHKYQMDLKVELDPHGDRKMQARIFYPAPIMPALKNDEVISGDIVDGSDQFTKISRAYLKSDDGWVKPELFGVENKYFVHSMVKDPESFAERAYFKLGDNKGLTAILEGETVTENKEWTVSFYIGPKEEQTMEQVSHRLEQTLDYSGMWAPISRILLKILNWLFNYFHNYGVAIIILTFLIRLLLLPFSIHAERSMKDRSEMQKRMNYIQKKFKDNPQERVKAQTELMKKHGLGLGGCVPMLMQLPIFLGLSRVLSSSILLYQAPFLWIPNLSEPDPYYILPLILALGMLFTALITPGDIKQRLPMLLMGVMLGAFSSSWASGLVLYIAVSVVLNAVQTKAIRLFRWA